MLALARRSAAPPMEALCLDAVAFSRVAPVEQSYDRLLLKEVVHHIAEPDVDGMYAGFFAQLRPGGVAVTVTRPQEVDYPLFGSARGVWRENQPPAALYVEAMRKAGFAVTEREALFPATLPKGRWFAMVRSRFWSTFSHFSDEELEARAAAEEEEERRERRVGGRCEASAVGSLPGLLFTDSRSSLSGSAVRPSPQEGIRELEAQYEVGFLLLRMSAHLAALPPCCAGAARLRFASRAERVDRTQSARRGRTRLCSMTGSSS